MLKLKTIRIIYSLHNFQKHISHFIFLDKVLKTGVSKNGNKPKIVRGQFVNQRLFPGIRGYFIFMTLFNNCLRARKVDGLDIYIIFKNS